MNFKRAKLTIALLLLTISTHASECGVGLSDLNQVRATTEALGKYQGEEFVLSVVLHNGPATWAEIHLKDGPLQRFLDGLDVQKKFEHWLPDDTGHYYFIRLKGDSRRLLEFVSELSSHLELPTDVMLMTLNQGARVTEGVSQ